MARISGKLREAVAQRADFCCEYCKRPQLYTGMPHEIDHIVPESKGGKSTSDNLALACRLCNSFKQDAQTGIDPDTGNKEPLFNPRTQIWSEHFQWSEDYTQILGITPTGRATVQRLQLNYPTTVLARIEWRKLGWTPPSD
jgi:hypothetical protein